MELKNIRKTVVAVVVVALTAVHAALSNGSLVLPIAGEWVPVVIAGIGAFLVWLVRNGDKSEE